jgi:hypothetical protein
LHCVSHNPVMTIVSVYQLARVEPRIYDKLFNFWRAALHTYSYFGTTLGFTSQGTSCIGHSLHIDAITIVLRLCFPAVQEYKLFRNLCLRWRRTWNDNVKVDLNEVEAGCKGVRPVLLVQKRGQ